MDKTSVHLAMLKLRADHAKRVEEIVARANDDIRQEEEKLQAQIARAGDVGPRV